MAPFKNKVQLYFLVLLVCLIIPVKGFSDDTLVTNRLPVKTITLAVASNFSKMMSEIAILFEQKYQDSQLIVVSGSSGKLYAQIHHGAPYDVFLSADQDKPGRLIKEGLAIETSQFTYASGVLVLWSANATLIDNSADILKSNAFKKLALANSKLAPYGLAAEQVLNSMGIKDRTRAKWVQAENIAQAYQFVASKNAEIGFVAKSQVWEAGRLKHGSAWLISPEFYSAIKQDAVILKKTNNMELSLQLMNFLQSESVLNMLEQNGYQTNSKKSKSL